MFFLTWGFLVWLGATALFRFLGHFFFSLETPVLLVASYILVIPFILILTLPIYRYKQLDSYNRLKAAILIALPGMLLDVVSLIYFSDIFINLDSRMDRIFGSWLLLAYSFILLSGFTIEKQTNKDKRCQS
ncbi:DUF5367 domain-containing protein [Priestia endophytica]|jgi:hypothetical protein|uniref:DUF5367 domain-containing protein n=1 Tax=Priestia endophytica DSM 13796 TaxID=1121089 RepID=A0A1I5Z367_9BACI|nr:DUF5367 domain-containing protein [Priestia endophytica]KAB2495520.1 hypothetical protein F8155_05905 [Priestia endophytica]KYG27839.1 hypothetical protein AZF06_12665 [Priestia endophytica]MCM3537421.1 DUF5367 domain-containing protein [Priestia endophytica]RAS81429.1 hypothetical protein A4U60_13405 [Priestia endophytica]SFQ50901.1 hypothetical protein SAMN02745910_01787 [Priestia endophytica DSM 13796]